MGDVGFRGQPPHCGKPFPMDSPVDDGAEPEHSREVWLGFRDCLKTLMRNEHDRAVGYRKYRVVHLLQEEAVKIDKIAADMERRNLASAVRQNLIATSKA